MATFEEHKDQIVSCPFNKSHRMKESKLQLHIAKCEKDHPNNHKATCPFNAKHRPEDGELNFHLLICDCRAAVDKHLIASNHDSTYRGHVGVPSYYSQPVETNENWDDEIQYSASGYAPTVEPPSGGIRTDFNGMKPSQRREYYDSLHQKNGEEPDEMPTRNKTEDTKVPELREPKTISYAQILAQHNKVHEMQNIGLGRGQPVASQQSTRIAANIYSNQSATVRQPKSAPQIPGFQTSNLGIGRGTHSVNSGDVRTGQRQGSAQKNESEFITVGRGRGKRRK